MNNRIKTLLINLAAILLGVSLAFAFAPYEIFPLAVIAPAGLLILLANASPKHAFWLGYLFGIGLFGTGVSWIYNSIHLFGDVPAWLSTMITAGFAGILALFPAAACYFTSRLSPAPTQAKWVFIFPSVWVFSEWFRSWMFTGFPWLFLGYSQTNSPLRGIAPFFSVYGVSLAVAMTSGLGVNACQWFKKKDYQRGYLNLMAIMTLWTAAGLLNLIAWTTPAGKPLEVSLVQGNIPQELKWSPEHLQLSFDRYASMTAPLWGQDKIIIWPEAAIPMTLQDAEPFINALDAKAAATGSHVILGIPIQTPEKNGYYNALVSVGAYRNTYVKRRLVPFGEYIPFQQVFAYVFNYLNIPMSDMAPGEMSQPPLIINHIKIQPSICYEIAFPELTRFTDSDIGLLLTVTNDAWFGKSSAQAQHLQMAQMRAIELGRPVLFVGNDGITAIINQDGKIDAAAPAYQGYVLNGKIQPYTGTTPWMNIGIDPLFFLLISFILGPWYLQMRARNSSKNSSVIDTIS